MLHRLNFSRPSHRCVCVGVCSCLVRTFMSTSVHGTLTTVKKALRVFTGDTKIPQ